MRYELLAFAMITAAACNSAAAPTDQGTPNDSLPPADNHPLAVTTPYPLTDLGTGTYLGFQGGLYAGGTNAMPASHATSGAAFVQNIRPLNAAGQPDPNGKYVLLSLGMSNTTQEFCGGGPTNCQSFSFVGQALADPAVNHTQLVLVDGAQGGQAISSWLTISAPTYTTVRDTRLAALGVTEAQVQVVWVKQAIPGPTVSLPSANSNAYAIVSGLGTIVRTLRTRYPNLQLVFLSSRIYAGYAQPGTLNPEPFAFESGLAVKWLIQAQITQEQGGAADAIAGDLRPGVTAPWLAWGPYLWANGTTPRADGLVWVQSDFQQDFTHPANSAREKVGTMLLNFLKTSPQSQCWFLAGRTC